MRCVRNLNLLLLLAAPAAAHMLSMSQGELRIDGTGAHYRLLMPLYEVAHIRDPEPSLFQHLRLAGKVAASHACRQEAGQFVCTAEFQAPATGRLEVECTFASITVPNHVHMLRAEREGYREQAMFDASFPSASLRFAPPSRFETVAQQAGAGVMRALGGMVQILFLASLVLAARTRRELMRIAAMFICGQAAAALILPYTAWQPVPRFVEAAAALTLAYLAVEILFLPEAGARWLVAGVLGAFHGLYLALVLQSTGFAPALVLSGAAAAELCAIALFAIVFSRMEKLARALRPVQVSAGLLLVTGMVWFFMRLRG